MSHCPACHAEPPEGSRFCPVCGTALPASPLQATAVYRSDTATETRPADVSPVHVTASSPEEQTRFAPGQILLGRYRIVSALGRGGMGEVYRADDLRLDQQVALKFLPRELVNDADLLNRLRKEVRIARQVSHPMVCRVHDFAEVDGQAFLTMEFIDGEDLRSLLKRIGRLPEDKAIQIAHQLCDGLAAVHAKGIVHRDLKPRNVMIDGMGQVRLTDFGLAVFADAIPTGDFQSGTPAFMAPEQLNGGPATIQSDLFALGLVLYELFTGRRPYPAKNRDELARMYAEHVPASIDHIVPNVNPRVPKVVRHCLELDPAKRPPSAAAVKAAFPRLDPLVVALAEGQTPSPEMVADAGTLGVLSPRVAGAMLVAAIVGVFLVAFLAPRASLHGQVPLELSPPALAGRAQALLHRLGYDDVAVDSRQGLAYDHDLLNHVVREDQSPQRWARLPSGEPPAVRFWYRVSPTPLVGEQLGLRTYPGRVTPDDPPLVVPGMVSIALDGRGRLLEFTRVPEREEAPAGVPPAGLDWKALFDDAKLSWDHAQATAPRWMPPHYAEQRMAWLVPAPDHAIEPIRVEAAGSQGRVTYFRVIFGPWELPDPVHVPLHGESRLFQYVYAAVLSVILIGASWLARRNVRRGIGDVTGATRLAAFQFACHLLCMALIADHVPSFRAEAVWFMKAVGFAALWSGLCWLTYVAVEPYVRRRWPWRMISWNRVLAGRLQDPLVGRDLLIAILLGIFLTLTLQLGVVLPALFQMRRPLPLLAWPTSYVNVPFHLLMELPVAIRDALQMFFLLFLLTLFVRNEWLAIPLVFGLSLTYYLVQEAEVHPIWVLLLGMTVSASIFAALRFGLLTLTCGLYFCYYLYQVPLTLDFSVWYGWQALTYLMWPILLAGIGFILARGGNSLLKDLSWGRVASTPD